MVVVVVVGERIGVEAMEVYLLETGVLGGWYLVVELDSVDRKSVV